MINTNKKHHILGLVMLTLTAIFWGAGFVLNDRLLDSTFYNTPALLLIVRFVVSTLFLLVVFNKRIRFNKYVLLYGGVGGLMLFASFLLQTIGQKYTIPSHSGFFTASYAMFVPFITWIAYKKRPSWITFIGVAIAVVGLVLLNFKSDEVGSGKTWLGDVLTVLCAIMFALQIFWTDYSLKKDKIDHYQLTFWQIAFGAVLFTLYSVCVESRYYTSLHIDFKQTWWQMLIVALGGTAFAYYAQTYSLKHLKPSEASLILACESPIGAFLSIILGIELFSWQTLVGGALVIVAVILVEVVPTIHFKRKSTVNSTAVDDTPQDDGTDEQNEQQ